MPFIFQELKIPGLKLLAPKSFEDERGFFEETYKKSDFVSMGINDDFIQDNHSYSVKGTLRGLHFQNPPFSQGKLVRCVVGRILDVAVDLRTGSPMRLKWFSTELSGDNRNMLWIPEGFAHGFVALENSHLEYKVTAEYDKNSEDGIIWNDPNVSVEWGIDNPLISPKDLELHISTGRNFPFHYGDV